MNATRDATVAARIPLDLRNDLEELARRGGVDLSVIIRGALRGYADAALGHHTEAAAGHRALFAAGLLRGGQGAARRAAGPTERAAALGVAPRVGTARRRALELLEGAGAHGLTADEVQAGLERRAHYTGERAPAVNGTARRVTDLVQGGLARPHLIEVTSASLADGTAGEVRTRPTRHGAQATVYVITAAGIRALEDARDRERSATNGRP